MNKPTEKQIEAAMTSLFGEFNNNSNHHAWVTPNWKQARMKVSDALSAALAVEALPKERPRPDVLDKLKALAPHPVWSEAAAEITHLRSYVERLQQRCADWAASYGEKSSDFEALSAALAVEAGTDDLSLGYMPSYGRCSANDMLAAVSDAIYGDRNFESLLDIDPTRSVGHQMVPRINFNSLNRIISAFHALTTSPASSEIEDLKEQLAEAEDIIKERDDRLALVDRIADLMGLPHDQELDQVAFELWFSANAAASPASSEAVAKHIVQGVCELQEFPDIEDPDTIIVTADDLEAVICNRLASFRSSPASSGVEGAAVVWQRRPCAPSPFGEWVEVREEDIPHYRSVGQEIRPLYAHPAPTPAGDGLVEFAKAMIRLSWEGCDADGGLIQETALKFGLLEQTVFDRKKHKDPQGFTEDGDWWYVFAGPLASPAPHQEGRADG